MRHKQTKGNDAQYQRSTRKAKRAGDPLELGLTCEAGVVQEVDFKLGGTMDYERKPIQAPTVSGFRFHTPYRSNSLMDHYAQFIFHHHDLCLFHQALYNEIAHRQEALSDFRRAMWEAKRTSEGELTKLEILSSRICQTVATYGVETRNIMAFADQLLMIGLWAIVEQYCSRTLVELEQFLRQSRHPRAAPYRWNHIVDRFSSWGLRIIDYTAYADVDECRVVNNKVKHVGSVDTELSRYAAFAGKLGTPWLQVEFPLQRYSDAIFEFISQVMGAADELVDARATQQVAEKPDSLMDYLL